MFTNFLKSKPILRERFILLWHVQGQFSLMWPCGSKAAVPVRSRYILCVLLDILKNWDVQNRRTIPQLCTHMTKSVYA